MTREAERLAAESRLEAAGGKRGKLEEELEETREALEAEIRKCAELGTPKTKIAALAGVDRSRVYQILGE